MIIDFAGRQMLAGSTGTLLGLISELVMKLKAAAASQFVESGEIRGHKPLANKTI